MPFMGKDWRSPGEAWVKTESLGWQRMKIIESQLYLTCNSAGQRQARQDCGSSWPPQSQFGKHMEQNCTTTHAHQTVEKNVNDGSTCDTHRAQHQRGPRLISRDSCGDSERCSSSAGSSSSSASSSPAGTPDKRSSGSPVARHIHPITISSPYGQYSATSCCAHHEHADDNNGEPNPNSNAHYHHYHHHHHHNYHSHQHNHHNHQQRQHQTIDNAHLSRSLSREPTGTGANDNSSVLPTTTFGSPSSGSQMRHNKSEPDFGTATTSQSVTMASVALESESPIDDKDMLRDRGNFQGPPASASCSASSSSLSSPATSPDPNEQHTSLVQGGEQPASHSPSNGKPNECNCCCCSEQNCAGRQSHLNLIKEMHHQAAQTAPHCHISVRTREVAMHNTISEAFYRLDFYNAIHDIRRFNYICKLLHLLITQNLISLSGCATRVLFTMLEQVAWEVSTNKRNIHVIRDLLDELRSTIRKYYCWGRPIGSSLLWQQHFETIERISQIVNGIELSPPKSSNSSTTFDKLPVEMIREILLRLSDYRDLVNSARASPVMQTMIDGQSIWQKLCRYHFSEQQLKFVLENGGQGLRVGNAYGSSNNKQRPGSLRGVKYARTTSADGRSSYRNPVTHKPSSARSSSSCSSSSASANVTVSAPSSSSTTASTSRAATSSTRQQLEQTSARRSGSAGGPGCSSSESRRNPRSSSYVTNAVKIFDERQRGSLLSTGHLEIGEDDRNAAPNVIGKQECSGRRLSSSRPANACTSSRGNADEGHQVALERSTEIDWERVFHQLRKRFDLKEEYADCLLLCRHCRCLFWKSFGHPCIRSEDLRQQPTAGGYLSSNVANGAHSATAGSLMSNNKSEGCCIRPSTARQQGGDQSGSSQHRCANTSSVTSGTTSRAPDRPRLSTAASMSCHNRSRSTEGDENAIPAGGLRNRPEQQARSGEQPSLRRQPLADNLGAQLRQHSSMRQQQQQQRLDHQPQRPANASASRHNGASLSGRREELVPKHVTISPQAFLKFFSL